LNRSGAPSPRAQHGRPTGWSSSTLKAILARQTYRGTVVYGQTAGRYGRELGSRARREKGQVHGRHGQRGVGHPVDRIVGAYASGAPGWIC
jgi:hypothetical protein